jgi:DNA-binding transcriptional LysR family regulator
LFLGPQFGPGFRTRQSAIWQIDCFDSGNRGDDVDRLRCIEVFVEVARDGSFTGAARRLGMSKATTTKHVAWLEQSLGAKLLNRTTKHVGLTEAGAHALAQAQLLLDGYEAIGADARELTEKPRGVVRVGTPPSFGTHHLLPLVTRFAERYPDIRVTLMLDDGSANLITQGLDLSLRIGPAPEDGGHISVPLTKAPQVLVASKAYLKQHGTPKTPADLAGHNCLVHALKSPTSIWRFSHTAGEVSVRVKGSVASNFGEALKEAALLGHGIAMHPYYMVSDDLKAKRLIAVLPGYEPLELDIYVVYPTREHLPERTRRFLEFLKRWAKTPPDWAKAARVAYAAT